MSKPKKPNWISGNETKLYNEFLNGLESKGFNPHDYNLLAAMFSVEMNEYIIAKKDIQANGQYITTQGANGYNVTKQSPSVQTKQANFKNIMEILKNCGGTPKSEKDIFGNKDNEDVSVLMKEILGGKDE